MLHFFKKSCSSNYIHKMSQLTDCQHCLNSFTFDFQQNETKYVFLYLLYRYINSCGQLHRHQFNWMRKGSPVKRDANDLFFNVGADGFPFAHFRFSPKNNFY